MIWLTWRQHRKQALFTLAGLAILAALMIPTGLAMHHAYVHDGLRSCLHPAGLAPDAREDCEVAFNKFQNRFGALGSAGVLLLFLPALVGLFWGAPLVAREVEHGTHRLVWTQGVSRLRWALVKFGLVGGAALVIAVAYALGMSWWLTPLADAGPGRLGYLFFDAQGLVPVGYTLFAVALGVFAGTVWHKVLPAMAVTLVGFLGVRLTLALLARPRYLPARTLTFPVVGATGNPDTTRGDWVIARAVRDASGKVVMGDAQVGCPSQPAGAGDGHCGERLGIGPGAYNWQLYQPAGRFWLFQGIETGIFVALAALLLYLAIRRIRRIS